MNLRAAWASLLGWRSSPPGPPRGRPKAPPRPPFEDLDNGIRDLVEALWLAGFVTTDSGDGSKFGVMECAMDFEHVAVECEPGDAMRLLEIARRARPGQKWQLDRHPGPPEAVRANLSGGRSRSMGRVGQESAQARDVLLARLRGIARARVLAWIDVAAAAREIAARDL